MPRSTSCCMAHAGAPFSHKATPLDRDHQPYTKRDKMYHQPVWCVSYADTCLKKTVSVARQMAAAALVVFVPEVRLLRICLRAAVVPPCVCILEERLPLHVRWPLHKH